MVSDKRSQSGDNNDVPPEKMATPSFSAKEPNASQIGELAKQKQKIAVCQPFHFKAATAVFEDFLMEERQKPEDGDFLKAFGVSVVEKPLMVSLENLFHGCIKKMKITRKVFNSVTGTLDRQEKFCEMQVKPGWQTGTKIKYFCLGDSTGDIEEQDIHFVVTEQKHARLTREGNDLRTIVEISLLDALTGWTQNVETIDGKLLQARGAGPVSHGHVEFYPGLGMPKSKKPGERGDLLVEVRVVFPRTLTTGQKHQIKSLGYL